MFTLTTTSHFISYKKFRDLVKAGEEGSYSGAGNTRFYRYKVGFASTHYSR